MHWLNQLVRYLDTMTKDSCFVWGSMQNQQSMIRITLRRANYKKLSKAGKTDHFFLVDLLLGGEAGAAFKCSGRAISTWIPSGSARRIIGGSLDAPFWDEEGSLLDILSNSNLEDESSWWDWEPFRFRWAFIWCWKLLRTLYTFPHPGSGHLKSLFGWPEIEKECL